MTFTTFEIRDYWLQPAMRDHFIDYFEVYFLSTQEASNMHVLGQFRVVGEPDRFLWIRAFENMQTRHHSLSQFYSSEYWFKHRGRVNGMLVDSDHVHLLRAVDDDLDLTRGNTLQSVAKELSQGAIQPNAGVLVIEYYRPTIQPLERAAAQLHQAYEEARIQVRGILTAEMSENTFPRLPAFQNEGELIVISAYENEAAYRQRTLVLNAEQFPSSHDTRVLVPTLRSPMRW